MNMNIKFPMKWKLLIFYFGLYSYNLMLLGYSLHSYHKDTISFWIKFGCAVVNLFALIYMTRLLIYEALRKALQAVADALDEQISAEIKKARAAQKKGKK